MTSMDKDALERSLELYRDRWRTAYESLEGVRDAIGAIDKMPQSASVEQIAEMYLPYLAGVRDATQKALEDLGSTAVLALGWSQRRTGEAAGVANTVVARWVRDAKKRESDTEIE